jgi:exopolyphosphatase/guanosine-5'-triphosphate,3'-diphosphate pyrophosphatase
VGDDLPVLGALDIGTNSFHLVLARPAGADRFETLTREKQVVRLGQGGGDMKELAPDAIDRGIACLRRMRGIADSYGATVRAVATSAVREAANAADFLRRAKEEADFDVEVISGVEEARLIHLGVLQAVPAYDERLLLIDIGGGSTEVLIGQQAEVLAARSFKLGAVRLTDRFFPGGTVTPKAVRACRQYARDVLSHFQREVDELGFEIAVGSSGTAESLARVTHAAHGKEPLVTYNCASFTRADLTAAVDALVRHRTAARRAAVPGLEAARADIIVAGAVILDTAADMFGIRELTFSEGALRDGVLVDTLARLSGGDAVGELHHLRDVSRRSIRQLAERCDDDPAHSAHVARLALELFDGLASVHGLDATAREYLEAGALLANVGLVVSHSKHHLHAYYVIRHSELAGLTDAEIEVIALIARYHRKSAPKSSHPPFAALTSDQQALVRTLAGILRVAIGLDRRHRGCVERVTVEVGPKRIQISVVPAPATGGDVALELYAANERKELLEDVLGRRVELIPAALTGARAAG